MGEGREHVGQPATGTLLIPRIGTAVIRHDPDDAPRPAAFFDAFELTLPERPLAPVALLPAPYSRRPHLIVDGPGRFDGAMDHARGLDVAVKVGLHPPDHPPGRLELGRHTGRPK